MKIQIVLLLLSFFFFQNINSYSQEKKRKKEKTTENDWGYNNSESGGFEYIECPEKKLPKTVKRYFKNMILIEGGTFNMGRTSINEFDEKDSTLIVGITPRRVTISSFYISKYEVSNKEYREFVNWVIDSVKLDFLAKQDPSYYKNKEKKLIDWSRKNEIFSDENIEKLKPLFLPENERFYRTPCFDTKNAVFTESLDNEIAPIHIYPDTICWQTNFSFAYNEPMTKLYFWHPAYDNYPVVGISFHKAQAYCTWLTKMVNIEICKTEKIDFETTIKEANPLLIRNFRLPTEAEWEFAAFGRKPNIVYEKNNSFSFFPWETDNLFDEKGNYYANFGTIIDRNGFMIKSFAQELELSETKKKAKSGDRFFYTGPVNSLSPNAFGLYNMSGNVAEWVMDMFYSSFYMNDSIDEAKEFEILSSDSEDVAILKLIEKPRISNSAERLESTSKWGKEKLRILAREAIHNAGINDANPRGRIIKGGSWAKGPAYMQIGAREVMEETKSSSMVGFRISMTRVYK